MVDPIIVDTNVLIVANDRQAEHATPDRIVRCSHLLNAIREERQLVIDDAYLILNEYKRKVNPSGQPGVGDAFLKWVYTNLANESRCTQVAITPGTSRGFAEFPVDPALSGFDQADRKFVAVAMAHPQHPEIANAVDSDWSNFHDSLEANGIRVHQLCPPAPPPKKRPNSGSKSKRP